MLDELYKLSLAYLELKNSSYHRDISMDKHFLSHRMSILSGQRGVGKTTIIAQRLIKHADGDIEKRNILYVPSDHFLIGKSSLYEIAESFVRNGGEYIAFDEIHKYPNWSQELKSIYDTFAKLKIYVSGSSILEIHKGSHDLSRRCGIYQLQGLSFREYLALPKNLILPKVDFEEIVNNHEACCEKIIDQLLAEKLNVLAEFKEYLKIGFFPYFLELNNTNEYQLTLEQNIIACLETDIPAIYPELTGNSIRKIRQLLSFISSKVPFKPNFTDIKKIINVTDTRTLKNYLKYLEDAKLIKQLLNSGSKLNSLESVEKIYLHNTNQYYALSEDPNIGTVRELFFISCIIKNNISSAKPGDFIIDNKYIFEVGGKGKSFKQIKNKDNAYLVCDGIEFGKMNKIPLWLFGFMR